MCYMSRRGQNPSILTLPRCRYTLHFGAGGGAEAVPLVMSRDLEKPLTSRSISWLGCAWALRATAGPEREMNQGNL